MKVVANSPTDQSELKQIAGSRTQARKQAKQPQLILLLMGIKAGCIKMCRQNMINFLTWAKPHHEKQSQGL